MDSRIIPLNLPARSQKQVAGNPVISRLESAIANCFPGLEIDHRNFDRRFFPGLIFNFISGSDTSSLGARLVAVDLDDLNSPEEKQLTAQLKEFQVALAQGKKIFLYSLRQNSKETIKLWNEKTQAPLDGLVVWRLIRSLVPDLVTVALVRRDQAGAECVYPEITARRRIYQTKEGTVAPVYQPGELGQSLCSPWQHDFRDCSCTYWASNRPDIVLADPGTEPPPGNIPDSDDVDRRLLWLRWDQSNPIAPRPTRTECRPFEMDHYEINERWQELPMVLEGRERRVPYAPGPIVAAAPFENQDQLRERLRELAGMEHALALEYLYARYSIKLGDATIDPKAQEYADYIAHELLVIATSEMLHLRWVNQLLWELWHGGHIEDFEPQLKVASHVPGRDGPRPVSMRPLDEAIDDFIAAEAASGTIEGAYSQVLATLRQGYSPSLAELSSRIIADGVSHFTRFREIGAILRQHAERKTMGARGPGALSVPKLVRTITLGSPTAPELGKVKSLYTELIRHLKTAYRLGHADDRGEIAAARKAMMDLDTVAIELASGEIPIGIPFAEFGYGIAGKYDNDPQRRNQR